MKIFQKLKLIRKETIKILKLESFETNLILNLKETIVQASEILKSQISRHFLLQFSTLSLAIISRIFYIINYLFENKEKYDEYLGFQSKATLKNTYSDSLNNHFLTKNDKTQNLGRPYETIQEKPKEEHVVLTNEPEREEKKHNIKTYRNFIDELFEIKKANKNLETQKGEKILKNFGTQPSLISKADIVKGLNFKENEVICLTNKTLIKEEKIEGIQIPLEKKIEMEEEIKKNEYQIKTQEFFELDLQNKNAENILEPAVTINTCLNGMINNYEDKAAQSNEPSFKINELTPKKKDDNFLDDESGIKQSHLGFPKKIKKPKLSKITKLHHLKKMHLKML